MCQKKHHFFFFNNAIKEEDDEIEDDDDLDLGPLKSDHEFSPESQADDDDEEWQPIKRARTARKGTKLASSDKIECKKHFLQEI